MIKVFKEKAPTLQAIEVTEVLNQLPEIANLVKADQAGVKVVDGTRIGSFTVQSPVEGAEPALYQVKEGQVIAVSDGAVVVLDAAEFYSKYEAI